MFPETRYHVYVSHLVTLMLLVLIENGASATPLESELKTLKEVALRIRRYAKPPSVPTAPLDPNDNIHHTLDEVNSILGTLGGASSSAVYGLTGISITDCALSIKEEDLTTITCAQFINKVSQCDSMQHLQPLLQQARQKYKKNPKSRAPCFGKKGKKGRKGK